MSSPGAHMLTKVTAVGVVGVLASMGMLLFTLNAAESPSEDPGREVMSQLAFEAHIQRGEVIECTYGEKGLVGVRRGEGGEPVPFQVAGKIPSSLLERIILCKVPMRSESPVSGAGGTSRGGQAR